MTLSNTPPLAAKSNSNASKPENLKAQKIGLVTRDYRHKFDNGCRDFSHLFAKVLQVLDEAGCDTVVFSPYSIDPRKGYDYSDVVKKLNLNCVKAIVLEEFHDSPRAKIRREAQDVCIYYSTPNGWLEYRFKQKFGSLTGRKESEIRDYVKAELPNRVMGNFCILVCGETNGVKYSQTTKGVEDEFGLRGKIPHKAKIILNPVHDRMSRFEMSLKRKFLSEEGRYVISLWNKGKEFGEQKKTRDGKKPAWMVCHDGADVTDRVKKIETVEDLDKLEIGIVQIPLARSLSAKL